MIEQQVQELLRRTRPILFRYFGLGMITGLLLGWFAALLYYHWQGAPV